MDTLQIKEGQVAVTSDGKKLGPIKEVLREGEVSYLRIGVTVFPDYWLAASWASHTAEHGGKECLVLDFPADMLSSHKLPKPG